MWVFSEPVKSQQEVENFQLKREKFMEIHGLIREAVACIGEMDETELRSVKSEMFFDETLIRFEAFLQQHAKELDLLVSKSTLARFNRNVETLYNLFDTVYVS